MSLIARPNFTARHAGREPVSTVAIQRFAEAYELEDPMFHDDAAARSQGLPGIVAPVSMLMVFAMPPYWRPGDPSMRPGSMPGFAWGEIDLPGTEMMATNIDFEFFEPLAVGLEIEAAYHVTQVAPKRTTVGEGNFIDFVVDFTDQNERTIARLCVTVYRYTPSEK